jgi:hypothetical protein
MSSVPSCLVPSAPLHENLRIRGPALCARVRQGGQVTLRRILSSRFGRGSIVLSAILIAGCCSLLGCRKSAASATSPTPLSGRAQDPATRDLIAIGDRVITAIVARNTDILLDYDHDPDDAASLQGKSGELYCSFSTRVAFRAAIAVPFTICFPLRANSESMLPSPTLTARTMGC